MAAPSYDFPTLLKMSLAHLTEEQEHNQERNILHFELKTDKTSAAYRTLTKLRAEESARWVVVDARMDAVKELLTFCAPVPTMPTTEANDGEPRDPNPPGAAGAEVSTVAATGPTGSSLNDVS